MKNSIVIFMLMLGFSSTKTAAQSIIWLDENLQETTHKEAFYYTNKLKTDGEVLYYFKGKISTDKNIFRKIFYENGKPNGTFYEYYSSGELKESGSYENGLRNGNWKEYYKNGKILKKGRYKDNEKIGIWKVFYKNI